jgi:heme-degrading monooxygenase HmoA
MAGTGIFRVLLRMNIKPGMEPEFERAWHDVGQIIADQPANLGHWLSRSTEEESVYYIVSDWRNETLFREFEHSDAHIEHRATLHPYRIDGTMSTMEIVYSMATDSPAVAPGLLAPADPSGSL